MSKSLRVYEVQFQRSYESMAVCAYSIKQAFYLSHAGIWSSGLRGLLGILLYYNIDREPTTILFCGCSGYFPQFFMRGAGKKSIERDMIKHSSGKKRKAS